MGLCLISEIDVLDQAYPSPKMSWVQSQIHKKDGLSTLSPLYSSSPSSSGARISPTVIVIIAILALIFFISSLLNLLLRYLMKQQSSSSPSQSNRHQQMSDSDTFQGQLQQLFHLHDSGLDQAFIDALPIFRYKEIMGLKNHFDCAICLSEFSQEDKLRLLPICSHAFHISCIDTWLLSSSCCPICRGSLFTPGLPLKPPILNFDDLSEEDGLQGDAEIVVFSDPKPLEIEVILGEKRVFSVRLGKFKSVIDGEGEGQAEGSSSNLDARRCYSMGSLQYVVGESNLQVTLSSDRDVNVKGSGGGQNGNCLVHGDMEGKKLSRNKGESFSVSKIWLWSKKEKLPWMNI